MSADGRPEDEVSLVELTALRARELSAEQEARLRMRMARDPEVENKLWALDNVHRLFEKPCPSTGLPAEMPYDVAARLQARIADQALRHGHHTAPGTGEQGTDIAPACGDSDGGCGTPEDPPDLERPTGL